MSQIWTKKIPIKVTENRNKIIGALKKILWSSFGPTTFDFLPRQWSNVFVAQSYHQPA